MPKNLVICLDGTNNQFGAENTNVVRLFQALRQEPGSQSCYYDPGVGTMGYPGTLTRAMQKLTQALGMAFGLGVTQNVINAYNFLMGQYEDGDQVFIFGFSRGALEARALAGLLFRCGLLRPELATLTPYALRVFQTRKNQAVADEFQATFARAVRVRFLGLWDTVTSFGNVWSPIYWPNTTNNPGIDTVRHAIALDERRAFFRQNRWAHGDKTQSQDVQERWFVGVHCDVGGGYPAGESALWTVPFEWIAREAVAAGLSVSEPKLKGMIGSACQRCNEPQGYLSRLHDSMTGLGPVWYLAEFVPRRRWLRKNADGTDRREWFWPVWSWFLPWLLNRGQMGRARSVGRARTLKPGDHLHRSVLERFAADPSYRPDALLRIGLTAESAIEFVAGDAESYNIVRHAR